LEKKALDLEKLGKKAWTMAVGCELRANSRRVLSI